MPAGRPAGSKNRRTVEREEALKVATDKLRETIGDIFDGDAHALLMLVYKDKTQPMELRQDAAKAAIRYEKPALASTVVTHRDAIDDLGIDDLRLLLAAAERSAGLVREENSGEVGTEVTRNAYH